MLLFIVCFHVLFKIPHCIQLHWTASAAGNKFCYVLFSFLFCYKYSPFFLVMASQIYPSFKRRHLVSKCLGFFNVCLILISHFDINFSFKCFLLCTHLLCFFSLLTLLRLSMAKSKISFGKCHIALENIWVTFKYLLILISKIISQ